MILLEASPNNGFFRIDGQDYPEGNYTLIHSTDISNESDINYTVQNVFDANDKIINSRGYEEFTGVVDDDAFITLLDTLKVISVGGVALEGRVYCGVIDYGDTSTDPNRLPVAGTPIEINSGAGNLSTWVDVPNDGQGAFSVNTVDGVTDIINVANGEFDFTELKIGDLIRTRSDLRVTTNTPNVVVKHRLLLGGNHASAFPLEFGHRFYSSQEVIDVFTVSTEFDLQEPFLLTSGAKLQVWADKSATIQNVGVRNYLFL